MTGTLWVPPADYGIEQAPGEAEGQGNGAKEGEDRSRQDDGPTLAAGDVGQGQGAGRAQGGHDGRHTPANPPQHGSGDGDSSEGHQEDLELL
jgi:hypothetical protein